MFLFVFVFYHVTDWMESNKLNWTELKAYTVQCGFRNRKRKHRLLTVLWVQHWSLSCPFKTIGPICLYMNVWRKISRCSSKWKVLDLSVRSSCSCQQLFEFCTALSNEHLDSVTRIEIFRFKANLAAIIIPMSFQDLSISVFLPDENVHLALLSITHLINMRKRCGVDIGGARQ